MRKKRFLRYRSETPIDLVKWMGTIADPPTIIQDENGELMEEVVDVLGFEIVPVDIGYFGVLLVETEEIDKDE